MKVIRHVRKVVLNRCPICKGEPRAEPLLPLGGGPEFQITCAGEEANVAGAANARARMIPAKIKRELFRRSQGYCEACGRYGATDPHHVKPKGRGGKDELRNLMHVHRDCHNWIHANPAKAEKKGWLKK